MIETRGFDVAPFACAQCGERTPGSRYCGLRCFAAFVCWELEHRPGAPDEGQRVDETAEARR